jgi:hypothetical protein
VAAPDRERIYRRLFLANSLAVVATGVATIALTLLAFDLAGAQARAVLGIALATKMGVNLIVTIIAAAVIGGVPRGPLLRITMASGRPRRAYQNDKQF